MTQQALTWRSRLAEITKLYVAVDAESARLRAALLGAVLRLTPYTMVSNLGSGALVLWAFRQDIPRGMAVWAVVLCAASTLGTAGWWRDRRRRRTTASTRAMHRATVHAAVLAGIWAVLPLQWFAHAEPAQQMLVATLFTGMMGAGAYVLSPLPLASLAWSSLFTMSALGALWLASDPNLVGIAALLGFYAPTVAIGSLSAAHKHAGALRSQAQSLRQERMLSVLLQDFEQNADEALWQTGAEGRLTHHSPRLASLLGVGDDELYRHALTRLMERRGVAGVAQLKEALDAGRPFRDLPLSIGDGDTACHLAINGKPLIGEHGHAEGWRGVIADVSERVRAERQLQAMAHTDSLTGLANRVTLRNALAQALRGEQPVTLLSLDLDHFKTVNDTLGHSAGDELLRAVARRLDACARPGDLVARLGGDEFAVLMGAPARGDDAQALARRLIDALSQPVELQGRRLRIGASVGVAPFDGGDLGVDELLVQADMALYAAKDSGRGRMAVYSPTMGERNRRLVSVEQGLRHAVERGQLSLHWQPKVDIASWKVVGAEALLRWMHPELGPVSPTEFITVAEQSALIDQLGHWALREACRALAGPLAGLSVSVNVSPVQLRDPQFVGRVREALREFQVEPNRLELEITETVFMGDVDEALERLHALRSLGLRVALDDFGTGYSSLAYLRRFPFDSLKIDRAFVHELMLRDDARAIVRTIAQLADTLGMRTVCEGVETAQQLAAVDSAGCNEVQGHLVSPPRPLAELVKLRRDWPPVRPGTFMLH